MSACGRGYKYLSDCPSFRWPICPPVRMYLYSFVYVSVRLTVYLFEYCLVSVHLPFCIFSCDIVCPSVGLYFLFPFVRPSDRLSVLSSSVSINACKSVVCIDVRGIPYF